MNDDNNKQINNDQSDDQEKEFEDVCFACRRPESKAGKMLKLPNQICVCDDCMQKTMDAISQFDYQGMLNNPHILNELHNMDKNKKG
ncbi:MAG: ClpX C4-type zinc finger protein, partial [Lachnospiraceae bacterium]|nr:ClpX C4-type zinc finger protein [Lachnospiraceae bacterium]